MAVLRLITSSNLVGCLHRQVGRLLAPENAIDIAGLPIHVPLIGTIAHQAAGNGGFTHRKHRGYRMTQRQRGNLLAPGQQVRATDDESDGPLVDGVRQCLLDLVLRTCAENDDLQCEAPSRGLHVRNDGLREPRIVRVHQQGELGGSGNELVQQLQPLRFELRVGRGDPGGVAAGTVEARDQAGDNGIDSGRENDGDGSGCRHRSTDGDDAAAGDDDRDLAVDEIGRQCRQPIELAVSPTILDGDVSALDVARFAQAAARSPAM